jgi:2-polyprenyl-3-methyl-5-hydroxy-6-metoxy-1,4-benzoquinol methylase
MMGPGVEWYETSDHYRGYIRRALNIPRWFSDRDWRYRTFFGLNLHRGGRLLDVGCGSGTFLDLARARGYRVAGVDGDRGSLAIARKRYGIEDLDSVDIGDFVSAPPESRYEVISLFEVLEHLEDPAGTLQGLRRALVPGGHIVISVPSVERWPRIYYRDLDRPPNHLTLWTARALEAGFAAAGLQTVTIRRSPLRPEDLWGPVVARLPVPLRSGFLGLAVKGSAEFLIGPVVARLLSLSPRAGSFTLLAIATRPASS